MLGLKILVADDEMHILQVVEYKLTGAGYRVLTASCGRSALEMARSEVPDLLITDLRMPSMDGLELCRKLQEEMQQASLRSIPAIVLTARAHDLDTGGSEGEALPENVKRIVTKPFSPRQLVAAVRELSGEAA